MEKICRIFPMLFCLFRVIKPLNSKQIDKLKTFLKKLKKALDKMGVGVYNNQRC